jgi:hypothetical protein
MKRRRISSRAESELWELFVGAFCFLQTNDVWFGIGEPVQKPALSSPQRINVPGDDSHSIGPMGLI